MKRSHSAVHICMLTAGLDAMKKGDQRFAPKVLRVLHECGRFSVFEATANQTIAKMMDYLDKEGFIEIDISPGYPWSNVKLTAKGKQLAGVQDG